MELHNISLGAHCSNQKSDRNTFQMSSTNKLMTNTIVMLRFGPKLSVRFGSEFEWLFEQRFRMWISLPKLPPAYLFTKQ